MRIAWVGISAWRDRMGQRLQAVQKHFLSVHYRYLFSAVLAASVFETDNADVKSPSNKGNITVQFLIILNLYFTSEVREKGQY
jgi:hypothetical protein